MQTLSKDVGLFISDYLNDIKQEIVHKQDKLSNAISEMLFDTVNDVPFEKEKMIPLQQRIAYLTGVIDTLKNHTETIEDMKEIIDRKSF